MGGRGRISGWQQRTGSVLNKDPTFQGIGGGYSQDGPDLGNSSVAPVLRMVSVLESFLRGFGHLATGLLPTEQETVREGLTFPEGRDVLAHGSHGRSDRGSGEERSKDPFSSCHFERTVVGTGRQAV